MCNAADSLIGYVHKVHLLFITCFKISLMTSSHH